jgi:putative FmdB family regulatory protein
MPTYVYKCSRCDKVWEHAMSIFDDTDVVHGDCGMVAKRVPQAVGITLKGAGFYKNDKDTEDL